MQSYEQLMKQANLSQRALARYVGVTQQLVSAWCRGKAKPGPGPARLMALSLQLHPDVLHACIVERAEGRDPLVLMKVLAPEVFTSAPVARSKHGESVNAARTFAWLAREAGDEAGAARWTEEAERLESLS